MNLLRSLQAFGIAARNVFLGGNLISVPLARNPKRLLGYANECLFLYRALARTRCLESRNIWDVLPTEGIEQITLANLNPAAGRPRDTWFIEAASYGADLVSLCLLCRILRPHVVFEIGTLRGYTALHFALNSPPDARVYTLDLPRDATVARRLRTTVVDDQHVRGHARAEAYCFDGTEVASRIHCLFGDSATFDYRPFEKRVDLFFIDGAHSYEYVRSDTLKALACCHPGSVIAWHDFGRMGVNGVSRWLEEFARDHRAYAIPGGSLAFMVVGAPDNVVGTLAIEGRST